MRFTSCSIWRSRQQWQFKTEACVVGPRGGTCLARCGRAAGQPARGGGVANSKEIDTACISAAASVSQSVCYTPASLPYLADTLLRITGFVSVALVELILLLHSSGLSGRVGLLGRARDAHLAARVGRLGRARDALLRWRHHAPHRAGAMCCRPKPEMG